MRGSTSIGTIVTTSSFGITALVDYLSSPSSVGSYMSYDILEMLIWWLLSY